MDVAVGKFWRKIFVLILFAIVTPQTNNSCRYESPGKGVIDFSFIGRTDGKASYSDEKTTSETDYSILIFILYWYLLFHID